MVSTGPVRPSLAIDVTLAALALMAEMLLILFVGAL